MSKSSKLLMRFDEGVVVDPYQALSFKGDCLAV
jgi:hypothetical protein